MSKELLGSLELNRVYQLDCLEGMKLIPDKSIDFICTDLPFGSTRCNWDTVIPFEPMWEQFNRIIKDNGAITLFSTQPFTSQLVNSNLKNYRYSWYWKKEKGTGFAISGKRPLMIIEEICVFYKKQPKYDPDKKQLDKPYKHTLPISKSKSGGKDNLKNLTSDGDRIYKWYTHETPHQLLEYARDNGNKGLHPTQKPLDLIGFLIKTYTNESDIILDACMGSGTLAVSTLKVGGNRKFIGFETDPKYIEICNARIEAI